MANKNISLHVGAQVKDFLLELLGEALSEVMELEVQALTGAKHGERCEDRRNSRNGYRERSYDSRTGELALRIPKLRHGSYFALLLTVNSADSPIPSFLLEDERKGAGGVSCPPSRCPTPARMRE